MKNNADGNRMGAGEPDKRLDQLAYAVIGAAMEVHRALGPGYPEAVYEKALCIELRLREIPFAYEVTIEVGYKGESVGQGRMDFLIDGSLVVEIKTVDELAMIHHSQVITYLKATGCRLGLLINFNIPVLKAGIRRVVLSNIKLQS
jgi:GxxExxY protein